jgi:hypothetical protein
MMAVNLRFRSLVAFFCVAIFPQSHAGDAVMWDFKGHNYVSQYSSTPPGGDDYVTADQAAESVAKVIKKQGEADCLLIWKSDRTGYFALCTGLTDKKQMVVAVGYGATEGEAEADGLPRVRQAGATSGFMISHRYTSYGADAKKDSPPLPDLSTSAIQTQDIDSFSPDGKLALCTSHSRGWKLRRLDLIDLQNFNRVIEFAMPMALFGSVTWSSDSKRLAFFGEERAYGDTAVYRSDDGKWIPILLPDRDTFPEPDLGLQEGERIFETRNDAVRPKAWTASNDLELERILDVVVEKNFQRIATVTSVTSVTIHFDADDTTNITSVAQSKTRKEIAKPKKPNDLPAKNVTAQPASK